MRFTDWMLVTTFEGQRDDKNPREVVRDADYGSPFDATAAKSPRNAFSAHFLASISRRTRLRRRIGTGGHQPCNANAPLC